MEQPLSHARQLVAPTLAGGRQDLLDDDSHGDTGGTAWWERPERAGQPADVGTEYRWLADVDHVTCPRPQSGCAGRGEQESIGGTDHRPVHTGNVPRFGDFPALAGLTQAQKDALNQLCSDVSNTACNPPSTKSPRDAA